MQGGSGIVTKGPAQSVHRSVGYICHGVQPKTLQDLLRALADTPQCADRQLVKEADHLGLWNHEQAVGLGQARRELRNELGGGYPDRAGDALFVGNRVADSLGNLTWRAQTAEGAGDVQERLVQGQWL